MAKMLPMAALFATAFAISGCASDGSGGGAVYYGTGYGYYDPYYDYYYRDGIYVGGGGSRPVRPDNSLPDAPRPPAGMGPGRPTTLPAARPPMASPRMGGGRRR